MLRAPCAQRITRALLLATTTAAAVTVVVSAWWMVLCALVPCWRGHLEALHLNAELLSKPAAVPAVAQQMGGGGETISRDIPEPEELLGVQALSVANSISKRLGAAVNRPGLKAIKAVLLSRLGAQQTAAIAQTGSTATSFRKYRPLVEAGLDLRGIVLRGRNIMNRHMTHPRVG